MKSEVCVLIDRNAEGEDAVKYMAAGEAARVLAERERNRLVKREGYEPADLEVVEKELVLE